MSGETPPGRFQSLNKKFPGSMSPGPNNHSPNGRGGHSRSRVLTSKVSAPRPINLPSLRREHASEWPSSGNGQGSNTTSSSSTATNTANVNTIGIGSGSTGSTTETKGWGSSPSLSQISSPQKWDDTTTNKHVDATEWPTTSDSNNSELQSSSSPVPKVSSLVPASSSSPNNSPHPPAAASRAWATVSTSSTPALTAEFPTAAETNTSPTQESKTDTSTTITAMATNVNKNTAEKKPENNGEKTILNETENLDWDEIVRQDLENDEPPAPIESETVLPSDRFTEDYDRSYPPQIYPISDNPRLDTSSPSTRNASYYHNNAQSSSSQQQHYHPPLSQSSSPGYYNNKNSGGYSRRDNTNSSWGNQHHHHNDWNNGYSRSNQERRASIDRSNNDGNNTWGTRSRRDSYSSESGGRGRGRGGNRYSNRRPSHDRTANFQPTSLLQRPRRMSELSQRSDRSTSRDETSSVNESIQHQFPQQQQPSTTSPVTLPAVIEQQGQGQQGEETLPASPGHRYTAAQREVMLTTAERAKKRRAEEEAELEASRERARKKAEALAALCESKSKPTNAKSDEDTNGNKSTAETSEIAPTSSSSEDSKKSTKQKDESKSSSALTDSEPSPIKSNDLKQKPETKVEPAVKEPEIKEIKEKTTSKQKDPATIPDAVFPKDDGKASTAWTQPLDKSSQLEDEEDNQRWEDYVKGIQSNKSSTEADNASSSNNNDAAASWNSYATRLQTSTEIRMNAAIDRFAAERNIDPSRLNNMRPKDREPLRLHRPQRDNYDNNRRGYNNNNRNSGDKYHSNRNGDHRHQQQYHDDGRRDKHPDRKDKDQSTSSFEQHTFNLESWPSLGEGQSKTSRSDKATKIGQKVSLDNNGEENSKISKKKNSNKDKNIDEEKNAPGKQEQKLLKKDNNDNETEKQKQDENGTILNEENPDILSGKGKEKHNSDDDKCVDDKVDESEPLSIQQEDKESGVSKNIVVAEENDLTTSTDSTYGLSTKDNDGDQEIEDKEEKNEEQQEEQHQHVDQVVDVSHLPKEEQVEEPVPEMIEASESGSFISQNITDTVSTPESEEPCVGRVRTYSAMAVFDHWTRAERHDYLQKSKECIFPDAIERLAELKPTHLTFRTVSDDIRPSSVIDTPPFNDGVHSPSPIPDNNLSGSKNDEYMVNQMHPSLVAPLGNSDGDVQHQRVPYTVSSFDGKVSPQFMPPMTMAGRQNFPVLVYQVPYNSQGGPFIPGSPNGTGGYGITTTVADNQQPMFIPGPMPQQQQFQGQPLSQQQSQHPSMMNVYLLSPNQMLPPWSGMPPVNNSPATTTTTNNHHHNHNNNQRRRR